MNRRRLATILAWYAHAPAETLAARLEERLRQQPHCPVSRYLAACQCFDRGRSAEAVRCMMIAHHAEPQFASAALLVFAGLNWISARGGSFLHVLLDTWEEFRRPEFDRTPRERMLLDAFAAGEPLLVQAPPLAQALWRLPIQTLRLQIREALLSPSAGRHPLLAATA